MSTQSLAKSNFRRQGILLCLVGPAGSGKTSIGERAMAKDGAVRQSISVTTRAPRSGEQNGVHYHFVTKEQFSAMRDRGEFFEWEEIHGNCYGTPRKPLEEAIQGGTDLLLIIDIRGALNVKKSYPANSCIVFVTPSSQRELARRMEARGALAPGELAKRLATARTEYVALMNDFTRGKQVDYLLLNEELDRAVASFLEMLYAERSRCSRIHDDEIRALCDTQALCAEEK